MCTSISRLAISLTAVFTVLFVCGQSAYAQRGKTETVYVIHADEMEGNEYMLPDITLLRGHVRLRHKGMYMDCDSAYINERANTFDAFSNIKMQQGDTLFIYGDYLNYDGYTSLAKLRDNCKLINKNTTLLTDSLNYDRLQDLAYYFDGGSMMDEVNVLTSEEGDYSPSTKESEFRYTVRLVNPKYTLSTDTLRYNTNSGLARIVGPSKIDSDQNHIVADEGWYNSHEDRSELTNRPLLYTDEGRTLVGDTVYYDREAGYSIARSNVVLTDSVHKNLMEGEYCYYNERIDSALVTGRARAIDYSQGDSIYCHADTFKVRTFYMETDSVYREVYAYHKVRIYKSDLQAVCDSLAFSSRDSCIRLYQDPILWAGEQQQLGEYIYLYLNDSTIDRVHIEGQALSVERKDSVHYNQVTGRDMWYYFTDGQLHRSEVIGNVLMRYYPEDADKDMIGLNESTTTKLYLYLTNQKITRMKMEGESSGNLHPIVLIPSDKLYLDNFGWFDYVRPLSPEDIFAWRGKKSGSELQYKARKAVPLPNRGLINP
jgi:lipopolysaccharide export system protein LptA